MRVVTEALQGPFPLFEWARFAEFITLMEAESQFEMILFLITLTNTLAGFRSLFIVFVLFWQVVKKFFFDQPTDQQTEVQTL